MEIRQLRRALLLLRVDVNKLQLDETAQAVDCAIRTVDQAISNLAGRARAFGT